MRLRITNPSADYITLLALVHSLAFNTKPVVDAAHLTYPTHFMFHDNPASWNLASAMCLGMGGRLAEPTTPPTDNALQRTANHFNATMYWVGMLTTGNKINVTGNITTTNLITGTGCDAVNTTHTQSLQSGQVGACVKIVDTVWATASCDEKLPFFCEIRHENDCPITEAVGETLESVNETGEPVVVANSSLEYCHDLCGLSMVGSQECWVAIYDVGQQECSLYYSDDPYNLSTIGRIKHQGYNMFTRECFSHEKVTSDLDTLSTPDPMYSCVSGPITTTNSTSSAKSNKPINVILNQSEGCSANSVEQKCPKCSVCSKILTAILSKCPTDTTTVSSCPPPIQCSTMQVQCVTNCSQCNQSTTTSCPTTPDCTTHQPEPCDCTTTPVAPTCPPCPIHATEEPCSTQPLATPEPCPIVISNMTLDEKAEMVNKMLEGLKIDTKNISSTRRKYESATDPRPSAKGLGMVGIALLTLMGLGLIVLDLSSIAKSSRVFLHNFRSFLGYKV